MLKTSYAIFKSDPEYSRDSTLSLCEITLNNLMNEGEIDERDFLDRVNLLNGMPFLTPVFRLKSSVFGLLTPDFQLRTFFSSDFRLPTSDLSILILKH